MLLQLIHTLVEVFFLLYMQPASFSENGQIVVYGLLVALLVFTSAVVAIDNMQINGWSFDAINFN